MIESAKDLHAALIDAYQPYVHARLEARGLEVTETIETALADGLVWLRGALQDLLELDFQTQPRGPLELFQEALRFPTDALEEAGVPHAARDEAAARALPGDVFGLAPASSAELGEAAWHAHLAWGATKAAAMRSMAVGADSAPRRRVGVLSKNLMDRSRIDGAVAVLDSVSVSIEGPGAVDDSLDRVLVDLEHPEALPVLASASAKSVVAVGYGPHVDEDALRVAQETGATAVTRSKFFGDLARFVTG